MTTITNIDLNNRNSAYARAVDELTGNAQILINVDEEVHLRKGDQLFGAARTNYEMEIRRRTNALHQKILEARRDPRHALEITQIAKDGLKELDTFASAFWKGREAAAKTGQSVSDQFAQIRAAAEQDLPFVAVRTGVVIGSIGGCVDVMVQAVRPGTADILDKIGRRVFCYMAAGGVIGGVLGEALAAKEAH